MFGLTPFVKEIDGYYANSKYENTAEVVKIVGGTSG